MFEFSDEENAFRAEVRAFIEANVPARVRDTLRMGGVPSKQDTVEWTRKLHSRGWATPSWPVEWGGPGWTLAQRIIFQEEVASAPAPEPQVFNVGMLGPVVGAFGSAEQKRDLLPRIARLDLWFCQGFSEPGAGSDLASLKTRAVRDGEHYVINGQKIWTSYAGYADWMFALVRTDPGGIKQSGISFLLIDLRSPGVSIRPIESIDANQHHLHEVFLEDVRVPASNLVGKEGEGWTYAKYLLGHERTGMTRVVNSRKRLAWARARAAEIMVRGRPLSEDPLFRRRIAELEAELIALQVTQYRSVFGSEGEGTQRAAFASILKLRGSELTQATTELLADVAGPRSLVLKDQDDGDWRSIAGAARLTARGASIYGGTSEIQKSILAKGILGL